MSEKLYFVDLSEGTYFYGPFKSADDASKWFLDNMLYMKAQPFSIKMMHNVEYKY